MLKRISFIWFVLSCFQAINAQNHFTTKQVSVEQNQDFDIEITVKSDTHIGGFQFDINFNDAYVTFDDNAVTSLIENYQVNYSIVNKQTIRIIGFTTSSENIPLNDTPVIVLKMKSLDNPGNITPSISNFLVSDSKGKEIEMIFNVNNISILGPKFYLDTQEINFGKLTINQNYNASFRVYNQGNLPLEISTIKLPVGVNSNTNFPLNIPGGDSKNIVFSVDTSEELIVDGEIKFETNDTNEFRAAQTIRILGEVFSKNELYLTGSEGIRGEATKIKLNFDNQKACLGIQFDLALPNDFKLNTENIEPSERIDAHNYSVNNIGNNIYRFLIYSLSNETIKKNEGTLLSFEIIPNSNNGTHQIEMQNAIATGLNRENILSRYEGLFFNVRTPLLNIQKNRIHLGDLPSQKEIDFAIDLYNPSSLILKIDSLVYNKENIKFTGFDTPFSIMSNESKSIIGSYMPTTLGSFNDTITIHHNGQKNTDNIFLTGNVTAQNYIYVDNVELLNDLTDTLRIKLNNDVPVRGIQFDLSVDQNINLEYDKIYSEPELVNFTISTSTLSSGKQRFLIYSTQKQIIEEANKTIFSIPINGNDVSNENSYDVVCSNIYITDSNNSSVNTKTSTVGIINIVKETSPVVVSQKILTKEDETVSFELMATDKDGDELSYVVPENSLQGGSLSSEGKKISYVPKKDFFGVDEFTYEVNDGKNKIIDKIKFEIEGVNDPPMLSEFTLNAKQNKETMIVLSSIDVDNSDDEITYDVVYDASFGITEIIQDTLYYKPENNFYGNDEITIRSFDGIDYSDEVNVLVKITKTNNATPVGKNLEIATNQDQKKSIVLIGYDYEDDEISFNYSNPQYGTLSKTEHGNIVEYTPNEGFFGTDSFTYTVTDEITTSTNYKVSIMVYENINLAPTISPINLITTKNKSVSVTLNGYDPEGSDLLYSIYKQANNGNALLSDNVIQYVPNNNYFGSDSVEIIVTDGIMSSDPTEIAVTVVEAQNTPPVGISEDYVLYNNTKKEIVLEVYDSDKDEVTFEIASNVIGGSLSEIIENTITYIPNADFSGNDAFTIVANDGTNNSTPFSIHLKVLPISNTKPTAISYSIKTELKQEIEVYLYGIDPDEFDKKNLTFEDVEIQNGSILEQIGNKLRVVPQTDNFIEIRYKVSDLKEKSDEAIIRLNFQ